MAQTRYIFAWVDVTYNFEGEQRNATFGEPGVDIDDCLSRIAGFVPSYSPDATYTITEMHETCHECNGAGKITKRSSSRAWKTTRCAVCHGVDSDILLLQAVA